MTSLSFDDNQLESVTVTFDDTLLQRSTPESGIYVFDCPYKVAVHKYRVDSVFIPPTQFHVDSSNNAIVFSAVGNPVNLTATIESGYYDNIDRLLDAVDAALTDASLAATGPDHTYTVEAVSGIYASETGQIRITQATSEFTIHAGVSSASFLLGLGSNDITSSSSVLTGPGQIRFTGPDAVSILSPTLSSNNSFSGTRNGNIITLPCMSPGQATLYHDSNASFVDLMSSQRLYNLELELRGSHGLPHVLQSDSPVVQITFATKSKPTGV